MKETRRAVTVGLTYSHLYVIEELPGRHSQGTRLYRCRCVVERDGAECGNVVVRGSHQLAPTRFRGCDRCQREHNLKVRKDYARNFVITVR